jgi:antitoxin VapB
MGYMAITLEDPETTRLANELAKLENTTEAHVVLEALKERLARKRAVAGPPGRATVDELMAIGKRLRALPDVDSRAPEEMLYDENGLPN